MEGGGRRVVVNNYDLQQVTIQENMNFLIPFEETNVLTFFSSSSSSSLSSPSFPIHNSSSTTNTTHAPLGFPNNLQDGGPLGSKVVNDDQDNFRGVINNDAHSSSWWRSSSGSGESKNKVKIRRKLREPRFCFQTKSDVDVLDDGYKWRKYGQKIVKNSLHPSGIGAPDGVPAPGFESWPLQNLHMGCSIRDRRPLHGEPHGDALAASLLTSVSSLDHLGGARILGVITDAHTTTVG